MMPRHRTLCLTAIATQPGACTGAGRLGPWRLPQGGGVAGREPQQLAAGSPPPQPLARVKHPRLGLADAAGGAAASRLQ